MASSTLESTVNETDARADSDDFHSVEVSTQTIKDIVDLEMASPDTAEETKKTASSMNEDIPDMEEFEANDNIQPIEDPV